jgi:hypothetical protein
MSVCLVVVLASSVLGQVPDFQVLPQGRIFAHGQVWASLGDWHASPSFLNQPDFRCGTHREADSIPMRLGGDCTSSSNNPSDPYTPGGTGVHSIKLVFHVICADGGDDVTQATGYLSPSVIQSQVDVLNSDFAGNGNGSAADTKIQFVLSGISYVRNDDWYADGQAARDAFMQVLNVDKTRYTNVYINSGGSGGLLGQAMMPWGSAGEWWDFTLVATDTVPGSGGNFGAGRTLVHELGHNYGLYHTFGGPDFDDYGSCPVGHCNSSGDLCCDTNSEEGPASRCTDVASCGTADPIDNFLDYTYDACMTEFTNEQAIRMRCVLETYRPLLIDGSAGDPIGACCYGNDCFVASAAHCQSNSGTWQGAGTLCQNVTCSGSVDPTGACCQGGNCFQGTSSECVVAGGTYQGDASECADGCIQPLGACCVSTVCTEQTSNDCVAAGGTWQGASSSCAGVTCSNLDGDTCVTAKAANTGTNRFDTTGLSLSDFGAIDQSQCVDTAATLEGPDIWFTLLAPRGDYIFDTCSAGSFDTTLGVYSGDECGTIVQVACDGDSLIDDSCQEFASVIHWTHGESGRLYIRVGGWALGDAGAGVLSIAYTNTCPGDLDADGDVDVHDLNALLDTFGRRGFNSDLNGDGLTDIRDLIFLLMHWTQSC